MSLEITTAFIQQYRDNVMYLAQQRGSRLRGTVRNEIMKAENAYFERVGVTAAQKRTTRHGDTPLVDTPHSRRRVSLNDYEWADLIDKADEVRLLINPESHYANVAGWAMGRAMDDEIIAAARGDAYSGKDGSTVVPLPTSSKIAGGATNLTIAKILEAKEKMDASEVDPDLPRVIVCGSKEITSLLNTTEIKNADYNTVRALAAGQIDTFCGFRFIRSERLPKVSTSRFCLAYTSTGIGLAVGMDVVTRMSERADKSYSMQVYLMMTIGATRIEEAQVVEIECIE
jgi:hypothetical protein